jgi:hypothetical protein
VLTARGLDLFPVVVGLRQWSEAQLFAPGEAHSTLLQRARACPCASMEVLAEDGRILQAGDTVVHKVAPQ